MTMGRRPTIGTCLLDLEPALRIWRRVVGKGATRAGPCCVYQMYALRVGSMTFLPYVYRESAMCCTVADAYRSPT